MDTTQTLTPARVGRWPVLEWILGLGLLALLVYAHAGALAGMVNLWNVSPMYSYGYTVPAISAYLLWTRRAKLASLTPRPARLAGTLLLLTGIGMLTAGRAGGIQVLEQVAFLVSLVAVLLLVLGRTYVQTAWAALAYLLLMIPIWDGLTEPLHAPFQQRSAAIGVNVLHAIGIPAYREDTIIALPGLTIEVARACSGVNYLVAVIALGLPLAYLYLPGFWRRAVLIVSAMVVAALSNGLRVALIGLLAHFNIGSPLHGPFHVLHGLFVSAAGYVVLFGGLWLLMPARQSATRRPSLPAAGPRRLPRPELVTVAVVFAALGAGVLARPPEAVPLSSPLANLPVSLEGWYGESQPLPRAEGLWPGADVQLHRRYRRADGAAVNVHVAYFAVQAQDREVANFRTADLHRRAVETEILAAPDVVFDANLVRDPDGLAQTLFWYEVGHTPETSVVRTKLHTMWNAVVHRRNSGTAIMLTSVGAILSEADLRDLGGLVHAALHRHVQQSTERDAR